MVSAQKSFISSTMWTERVGPAAALATVKKFRKLEAHKHLMEIGRLIQEGWEAAGKRQGLAVKASGVYPLSHFIFDDADHLVMKAYYIQEMLAKGFLASNLFYSMLAHTRGRVASYLAATHEVFGIIKRLKDLGQLQTSLKGEPAGAGFKRIT